MAIKDLGNKWTIILNTKDKLKYMPSEKDARKIQEELAKKNINQSDKKLTFDPTTGELIIKPESETTQKPGEIVVDQIYKDGFFYIF